VDGKQALDAERHFASTALNDRHVGLAVTHSCVNASGCVALRRDHMEEREAGMGSGPVKSVMSDVPRRLLSFSTDVRYGGVSPSSG
jgi:hypothetical protein